MKHLRIGVDLDGVIYDYANSVRRYLAAALDRPLDSFPDPTEYRFTELWCPGTPEEKFVRHLHAGVDAGVIFGWGGPYAAATGAAFQHLLAAGHQVHIVTARALGSPGAAEAATRAWLAEHSIPFTSLTIAADKTSVPTDVFVEDYLPNVAALEAAGVECWVIDRPWNQVPGGDGRRRVASITDFTVQVAEWAMTNPNLRRPATRAEETLRG